MAVLVVVFGEPRPEMLLLLLLLAPVLVVLLSGWSPFVSGDIVLVLSGAGGF